MILCSSLLLKGTIVISILTFVMLVSYLSSYFPNEYVMAAHFSPSVFQKPLQQGGIQVCCAWGDKLADGILIYRILGGSSQDLNAVNHAIDEWNSKITGIKLVQSSDNSMPADVDIQFSPKELQVIGGNKIIENGQTISAGKSVKLAEPGESVINYDYSGFINHVDITLATSILGNSISSTKLESIAKHEIGHAYGIGHTDFVTDLMSPVLSTKSKSSISGCDINAAIEANAWKIGKGSSNIDTSGPYSPPVSFIKC
jgi:matrixin